MARDSIAALRYAPEWQSRGVSLPALLKSLIISNMTFEKNGYVYILTNKRRTVLYIGVTNDLLRRFLEHQTVYNRNSFTSKYNVNLLVYYEIYATVQLAITREKQLKNLVRRKKMDLINNFNPEWKDLSEGFF